MTCSHFFWKTPFIYLFIFFGHFFSPKASLVLLYLPFLDEVSGDMLSSSCFWDFVWNRFPWGATFLPHPMTWSPWSSWKWVKEWAIVFQSQDIWILKQHTKHKMINHLMLPYATRHRCIYFLWFFCVGRFRALRSLDNAHNSSSR